MTREQLEARFPALLPALVAHEGIGFVLVRSAVDRPVVLGARRTRFLVSDRVDGEDPLDPFGHTAYARAAHAGLA